MNFNLGERVKYFREAKGFTVNHLADVAGIAQSSVREIELGINKNPKLHTIEEICDVLGVSLKDFFDIDSNSDKLSEQIKLLTPEQKDKLAKFLQSII